jgi:hypothetical protein
MGAGRDYVSKPQLSHRPDDASVTSYRPVFLRHFLLVSRGGSFGPDFMQARNSNLTTLCKSSVQVSSTKIHR